MLPIAIENQHFSGAALYQDQTIRYDFDIVITNQGENYKFGTLAL